MDIRLSRLYSCSFLRVTSKASSPPYVAFPLPYVAALRPYCRQLSVTGRPASASFRIATVWGLGELRRAQGNLLAQSELIVPERSLPLSQIAGRSQLPVM